ncbi:MAG TPA: D-amino acid aminotransferase [Novimethylophilus sp.]|jgi:D-alanine transaminase|uniref:D-amino acid aminotransferase n=1 Tax=Novimethylophilus sp. TaxID=2137426 RepID=UPI002F401FE2
MSPVVHLNGQFLPLDQAFVPVLDRGFIFGDGVYEVIPVYSRHVFRLEEHLRRLQHSLDGIRLANPHTDEEWGQLIRELVARNAGDDQYVYFHITRGVAKRDHAFPQNTAPTVFMMSSPLITSPQELVETGISAVSANDNRWDRCDIKSIALLPNVLLRQVAVDHGAAETVLFRDGILTEGSASNIFAVENGVILAPPKDNHMLPGITYDLVLELAAAHGIPLEIGKYHESRIRAANELWLTSSTKEVLPIIRLDAQPVGDGKPGAVFWKMHALYQDYKTRVMRSPA